MKRFGVKLAGIGAGVLLVAGVVFAIGSSDSIVSLSYLNGTYIPAVTQQASQVVENQLNETLNHALNELETLSPNGTGSGYSTVLQAKEFQQGDCLALPEGGVFLPVSGTVQVAHSGAVINVTTGTAVLSGSQLDVGNRYIVAEGTRAEFTVISGSAAMGYQGAYTYTAGTGAGHPFTDVSSGDWYNTAVAYVYQNRLFAGMGDGTFGPKRMMDRSMVMTVFYHLAGDPERELNSASATFTDVSSDQWYAPYVNWGATVGVTGGTGGGRFSPAAQVTREQLVVLLYNFSTNYLGMELTERQSLSGMAGGEEVSVWAREAMAWALASGVISGSDTGLNPGKSATRAEVAAILMNFSENCL